MSLLYGLPGQNRPSPSTSIVNAVGFGAREIALAPLRLRPGSALHERYAEHPERFEALPRKAWPPRPGGSLHVRPASNNRRRLHPRDAAPVQRGRHAAGEPAGAFASR